MACECAGQDQTDRGRGLGRLSEGRGAVRWAGGRWTDRPRGAEFRLPILVAVFGYGLRRAVGLNLGISLVTVLAGVTSRMVLGHATPSLVSAVGFPMAVGGMLGAYGGSSWLARVRDSTLHRTTRWLLFGIGVILFVEALTPWVSTGLPLTGVSPRWTPKTGQSWTPENRPVR